MSEVGVTLNKGFVLGTKEEERSWVLLSGAHQDVRPVSAPKNCTQRRPAWSCASCTFSVTHLHGLKSIILFLGSSASIGGTQQFPANTSLWSRVWVTPLKCAEHQLGCWIGQWKPQHEGEHLALLQKEVSFWGWIKLPKSVGKPLEHKRRHRMTYARHLWVRSTYTHWLIQQTNPTSRKPRVN